MSQDESYYWTVDGVPACQSPHTWGPDIDPPFACAGSAKTVTQMMMRFRTLRPGHMTRICKGHCPESGLSREGKWS